MTLCDATAEDVSHHSAWEIRVQEALEGARSLMWETVPESEPYPA